MTKYQDVIYQFTLQMALHSEEICGRTLKLCCADGSNLQFALSVLQFKHNRLPKMAGLVTQSNMHKY